MEKDKSKDQGKSKWLTYAMYAGVGLALGVGGYFGWQFISAKMPALAGGAQPAGSSSNASGSTKSTTQEASWFCQKNPDDIRCRNPLGGAPTGPKEASWFCQKNPNDIRCRNPFKGSSTPMSISPAGSSRLTQMAIWG